MTDCKIAYEASSEVHDVISRIGRTEDIKLSPDNKRLAVVDFLASKLFIFSIRIDRTYATPKISLSDYVEISSDSLLYPHGITFLDNDHIVVCNRSADVNVFRIPPTEDECHEYTLAPLQSINGKGFLWAKVKTPGSVDGYKIDENCYRILVCNNHWHFVTSHIVKIGNTIRIKNNGVLIENALKIPDGISISNDKAWIAISNHVSGEVLVYENTVELNSDTPPVAVLRGTVCPHGVRFSPDGKRIFSADAASRYLHVFESKSGEWRGVQEPGRSIRLLDDDAFLSGRTAAGEGGLKAVDIDRSGAVLITSRKYDVIAFYDLSQAVANCSEFNEDERSELCRQRDRSLERHHNDTIGRRWDYRTRVSYAFARTRGALRRYLLRASVSATLLHLYWRNRWSRQTILDPSGPALSLTTHGHRLELAFYAIESIGRGTRKPSSITLWIGDEATFRRLPETLRRLEKRGLDIRHSQDLGPHTKYYPYIDGENDFDKPLVTADDDMLYSRDWLEKLIVPYSANPSAIHCYRAHRMHLNHKGLMPYSEWTPCLSTLPSHANFVTGVSGAIYPPGFLAFLKLQGMKFERCCPTSDDIWISVNALRSGFKIAQIGDVPAAFPEIPGSQKQRLFDINVLGGANQPQLMRTYSETDLANLRSHLSIEKETSDSGAKS